jgi:CheY-like chemotaxis protein
MTKPLILFVDDDPNLLSGLRRLTRGLSNRWDMEFVSSGEAALDAIDRLQVNLVVSDMRMPGMDGARLLEMISQKVPGIFRFALSGESDVGQAIRIIGRSHRFLAKPIEPETLFSAIDSLFIVGSKFLNQQCGRRVSIFDLLKCGHGRLATLKGTLAQRDDNQVQIAAQIMSDPSLAVRILQVSNSSYFGKPLRTIRIPEAIRYIGLPRLSQLLEKQSLGDEAAAGSDSAHDSALRAGAAILARQKVRAAGKSEDEQDLAYVTALFSGLGAYSGGDPPACASRPACISMLFGLPQRLIASLKSFGENPIPPRSEADIAALAVTTAAKALEQGQEAA